MKSNRILGYTLIGAFLFTANVAKAQFNLGSLLDKAKSTIENVTATSKFEAKDLVGNWKYKSPAVNFKGDNALANIGSAAGASTIEDKLAPYYNKIGLQKSTLQVNEDLTFTFALGVTKLTGTIEKTDDSDLVFNFKAFNKINIGKVNCIATKSGNTVNLTFDAQKLLNILQKVSSLSSNSALSSINSLLSNYKDLYLGMKMDKK